MKQGLRKITYVLAGEVPSQKNGQSFNTRTRTMYKTARFREWRDSAELQLETQGTPSEPYEYARIRVTFVHSDLRRRDGENALSGVQDLLVRCGVIVDDCWTRIGTPIVTHDVGPYAKAVIEVTEVEPTDWASMLKERKAAEKAEAFRGRLNLWG